MGVRLMNLASGDSVVGLARNAESLDAADDDQPDGAAAECHRQRCRSRRGITR